MKVWFLCTPSQKVFYFNIIDVNKREFIMLLVLIMFTIILGIYPNTILDGIHYSVTTLIYDMPTVVSSV